MQLFSIHLAPPDFLRPISTLLLICTIVCAKPLAAHADAPHPDPKPRVIVTTDGETDDRCSMNRFLLYTNDWNVLGLIHSSSKHHWKGDDTHPEKKWEPVSWLDRQLDAYEAIHPSLSAHDKDYPTADYLRAQVFVGNIAYEGDMELETPGSNRIAEVLLDGDDSPVWLQAWGGPNTIARALKSIETRHPERMAEVSKKARIYLISEQDVTYKTYIRDAWPDIQVLRSGSESYGVLAYRWQNYQTTEMQTYFDKDWMTTNMLNDHGPLGALYETKDKRFRSEGDSPAFLHVINTGLRSEEDPRYGGWGGQFAFSNGMWRSVDGENTTPHSILRWAIDFQNDWAARADWCVKQPAEANHHPQLRLASPLDITAKAGETIALDASLSKDPDGDVLSFRWWFYEESSTYGNAVAIEDPEHAKASVTLPMDGKTGDTFHFVCTATDGGTPTLRRHARLIVTIVE